jgi:long-subunit fatty acid transport protein
MKRQILIPALCMVVLLLAQTYSIQAQIVKRGQAGFRFLENPISAEAIGRGGLGVALMNNSNSVFWNPAGLGWISGIDVSFNYTKGIADINHSSAAVGIPVGNFGVLALSGIFMDYGDFYGTRRASNDAGYEETGTFSPAAMAFGLAFSQRVTDRFSYGVHLKYAHQDLGSAWVSTSDVGLGNPDFSIEQRNYSMGVPAVDIGAYYDFMVYGIRFGAVVQNISREIEYEIEDFPLPFAISFGATVEPLLFFTDSRTSSNLVLAVESRHPRDFRENIKFGAEYRFENFLVLRAGYMDGFDERGFTAGAGVMQQLAGVGVRINYGYEAFGLFGGVHYVSIGLSY